MRRPFVVFNLKKGYNRNVLIKVGEERGSGKNNQH